MTDSILCVAALMLLVWIIYLKAEVGVLTRQTGKLASLLKGYLKDKTTDTEAAKALDDWNKRHKT